MNEIYNKVKERLELEQRYPGSIARAELLHDIKFIYEELNEREAEIAVLKQLLSSQAGTL